MMRFILKFFEINILKTVLLNFKLFSFGIGIRFPIIVYGKYTIFHLMSLHKGQIELQCPCKTGMVRLNRRIGYNIGNGLKGSLYLRGKLIIKGICDIGQGCNISIREGAIMEISDNLSITGASKINVYDFFKLGRNVFVSWNVQIHDTDYHYFIKDDRIFPRNGRIEIGDNVWIGHDVTISKGAVVPPDSIVASNSMINSKYNDSEGGLLIAGIPAKVIRSNVQPINNYNMDAKIDSFLRKYQKDFEVGILSSVFD
ncbi:MAG: hypothetical protein J6A40_09145 [Bacteroides sp.]|nr:hypothetical protein [Bacteroides sp.]